MGEKTNKNIKVTSHILTSTGDKDEMTLYTEAQYDVKAGKKYLRYTETEVSGMEGTKTMLIYDGETIKIKRFGSVNSELIISKTQSHEVAYRTPYGVFMMTTQGSAIAWNDEGKLNIHIEYTLIMEGNDETSLFKIQIAES